MKYIIVEEFAGHEAPVIFDECLSHRNVAKGLGEVISAGFVAIDGDDIICCGTSTTLGIKSR